MNFNWSKTQTVSAACPQTFKSGCKLHSESFCGRSAKKKTIKQHQTASCCTRLILIPILIQVLILIQPIKADRLRFSHPVVWFLTSALMSRRWKTSWFFLLTDSDQSFRSRWWRKEKNKTSLVPVVFTGCQDWFKRFSKSPLIPKSLKFHLNQN